MQGQLFFEVGRGEQLLLVEFREVSWATQETRIVNHFLGNCVFVLKSELAHNCLSTIVNTIFVNRRLFHDLEINQGFQIRYCV